MLLLPFIATRAFMLFMAAFMGAIALEKDAFVGKGSGEQKQLHAIRSTNTWRPISRTNDEHGNALVHFESCSHGLPTRLSGNPFFKLGAPAWANFGRPPCAHGT
jgi:hypothetical protein